MIKYFIVSKYKTTYNNRFNNLLKDTTKVKLVTNIFKYFLILIILLDKK